MQNFHSAIVDLDVASAKHQVLSVLVKGSFIGEEHVHLLYKSWQLCRYTHRTQKEAEAPLWFGKQRLCTTSQAVCLQATEVGQSGRVASQAGQMAPFCGISSWNDIVCKMFVTKAVSFNDLCPWVAHRQ